MTDEEAKICFEKHLPVVCVKAQDDSGFVVGNEYFIADTHKFRHFKYKKEGILSSVSLEQNERSTATVSVDAIEPAERHKKNVAELIRQRKIEIFKNLIAELKQAGSEKSAVLQKVNKFYDECKTE